MRQLQTITARTRAIHDRLTSIGLALAAVSIGLLALIFCGEVVARYVFSQPTSWSQDLAGYLLVASVFLASPQAAKDNAHVSVSFIAERLGGRGQELQAILTKWLAISACFLSAYVAASAALKAANNAVLTEASLAIPQWWLYALVSYGLASSGLHFARNQEMADGEGSSS